MKSFLGKHVSVVSSLTINIDIKFCKKKTGRFSEEDDVTFIFHVIQKNPPKICSGAVWKELQPVGGKAKKVLQILISHNDDGNFLFRKKVQVCQ